MLLLPKPLKGDDDDSEYKEAYEEAFKKVKGQQYVP